METQYLIIVLIIIIYLFLIYVWTVKAIKIFLWSYIAWFLAIITYFFIDFILNYISNWYIKLENPDKIQGFIINNQIIIALIIYFIFLILSYKSQLFQISIDWLFKKIIWLSIIPIITIINFIFTILFILNGTNILTYQWYIKSIENLNLKQIFLIKLFNLIPFIMILVPLLLLFMFLNIKIKLLPIRNKKNITETQ